MVKHRNDQYHQSLKVPLSPVAPATTPFEFWDKQISDGRMEVLLICWNLPEKCFFDGEELDI